MSQPARDDAPHAAITAELEEHIDAVDEAAWDALTDGANPFLRHAFLRTLEDHGCVGDDTGWLPRHLLVKRDGVLVAAAPLYIKLHSQGEFVFDHAFADAYERAGGRYYPKLVSAVPFTPATGPRLLAAPGEDRAVLQRALGETGIEFARQMRVSSLHWLFPPEAEANTLAEAGYALRSGCQFHWHNNGYADFDDYLASLTSKRRKAIKRERREAAAAPVEVLVLSGHEATPQQWRAYHALYASTYDRKYGYPALTEAWFEALGHELPDQALLVLARRDGRYVAGAHLLVGDDTLYGRNWGCSEFHPALHFEMCYYRPIEYAIERGLARFEAGAQGEHKLLRGFVPTTTYSAHWFGHSGLDDAVRDFLGAERDGVQRYIDDMAEHAPFRRE